MNTVTDALLEQLTNFREQQYDGYEAEVTTLPTFTM